MTVGYRTFTLLQFWEIPLTCRDLLLRLKRKNYHPRIVIFPTLQMQGGSFECFCKKLHLATREVDIKSASGHQYLGPKEKHLETLETVGAFQKLPVVMSSVDILSSAQRKTRNVTATKGIRNIAKRERNKGAKQLDTLMKELTVPLRVYIESFPKIQWLHPYERSLIELTFGNDNYEELQVAEKMPNPTSLNSSPSILLNFPLSTLKHAIFPCSSNHSSFTRLRTLSPM